MKKILFVCSGNTCRSPMAEGLFNYYAKKNNLNAVSLSAGIFAHGERASDNSVAAMMDVGVDISSHIPTQLSCDLIDDADIILTMTKAHKEYLLENGAPLDKTYTLSEFVGQSFDISDPFGGSLDVYQSTAREIETLILKLIKKADFNDN